MEKKFYISRLDLIIKIIVLIVIITLSIFMIRSCNEKRSNKAEILVDMGYGTGILTKYQTSKYGPSLDYEYSVEGIKYNNGQKTEALSFGRIDSYKCVGVSMEIVYSSKKPNISYMLAVRGIMKNLI